MNPANAGSMKLNVASPMDFSDAASAVMEPKLARWATGSAARSTDEASNRNARPISMPPPATNGAIHCTPYSVLASSFSRM